MKLADRMYLILLSEWQNKLTLLFTGLFLYQYMIWFSSYWLPETIAITDYTLIAVFLIEAIDRLNWMLRRLLQLLTLLAIHGYVLDYVPIGARIDSIRAFTEMIGANMQQVVPYLWFSLSCWAVYLAIVWWVKVKIRIYSLILAASFYSV